MLVLLVIHPCEISAGVVSADRSTASEACITDRCFCEYVLDENAVEHFICVEYDEEGHKLGDGHDPDGAGHYAGGDLKTDYLILGYAAVIVVIFMYHYHLKRKVRLEYNEREVV